MGRQFGDYVIAEKIGEGGMGAVYRARHVHLHKDFALKIMPGALAGDSGFVARFHDEARVMSELRPPGIVQVHAMSCHEGEYFLAMDYVTGAEGRPLNVHEWLKTQPGGRAPQEKVREWAVQIAEALAYAHGRGVVHRDIKPANILVDSAGNVRLTDFGLAKVVGGEFISSQIHKSIQESLSSHKTVAAPPEELEGSLGGPTVSADGDTKKGSGGTSILGTYDYMAPEQRGEGGAISPRTDVYSFGVLLYRMLTGKRPSNFAKPPSQAVPGLWKRWDAITARCLAESPVDRYESAEQMLCALRGADRGFGSARRVIIAAGAAAVVVAAVVALALSGGKREPGRDVASHETKPVPVAQPTTPVEPPKPVAPPAEQPPAEEPVRPTEPVEPPEPAVPAVTLAEVAAVKAEAEVAWGRIKDLDRGQGFAPKLDEVEKARRTASTIFAEKDWAAAKPEYDSLLEKCRAAEALDEKRKKAIAAKLEADAARQAAGKAGAAADATEWWRQAGAAYENARALFEDGKFDEAVQAFGKAAGEYGNARGQAEALDEKRKKAIAARAEADAARQAAGKAGAEADAADLWTQAGAAYENARALFEDGKFDEAVQAFGKAAGEYGNARKLAENVARVREAKSAYEMALGAQDADKLAKHGGAKWTEVLDAVKAATGAGNDFEKAVKEYKRARDLLPDAARAAEQAYRAALLATAKANDSKERGKTALAALDELLKLEPNNAEAKALKEKIGEYYVPKPGDVLTNSIGMKLAYIPPGEFMMGSPAGEKGRYADEGPQHRVRITKGFYMGATEVTQAQWQRVMGNNPSKFKGESLPVETVSWADATEFCRKLSAKEGKTYRLPTEAEWEYACRAGSTGPYAGNGRLDDMGWYSENSGNKTHAVATKQANAWGLYDMHGNVWEWCEDWDGEDYYKERPNPDIDPKGPGQGDNGRRVLRGGSWYGSATFCRVGYRNNGTPSGVRNTAGFRVSRTP